MTFADIEQEFADSFGFVRGDMKAICSGTAHLQYTLMLLVCCACEMLAAARGNPKHPAPIFQSLLPAGDWQLLGSTLFNAIRNGLAHGFDTKHLIAGQDHIQIYFRWEATEPVATFSRHGLLMAPRLLAESVCREIDRLEEELRVNPTACDVWFHSAHLRDRSAMFRTQELAAWHRLVESA